MNTFIIRYVALNAPEVLKTTDAALILNSQPEDVSAYEVNSEEDLREVPTATLVAIYNQAVPGSPVKKFQDRATAWKRVFAILDQVAEEAEVPAKEETPVEEPNTTIEIPESETGVPYPAAEEEKKKEEKKTPNGKGSPAKGRRLGIGRRMAELIRGLEADGTQATEKVLAAIKEEFPDSRAKASDVSIIRRKVKKGEL